MALWSSILKPNETVAVGVGLGVVDAFIFNTHLPAIADIRTADPQNTDIDASRRTATGLCIAINGLVSVMTRDWNVFLIGGVVTVGLAWLTVHANAVHPATGTMVIPGSDAVPADQDNAAGPYSMPDYGDDQAA
jgi:hypothetical protein